MLYGIDYRDMHTAIHHLLLFDDEKKAVLSLKNLQQSKNAKYQNRYDLLLKRAFRRSIDDIEVNYRNLTEIYETNYHENISGHVKNYTDKVKIINFEKSIDIY